MADPTITQSIRFFGPGLPDAGIEDVHEAYTQGLVHARAEALINILKFDNYTAGKIVANYEPIIRTIADATDRFISDNGTLLGLIERDIRRGGDPEPESPL
jgi:hypothetical protein